MSKRQDKQQASRLERGYELLRQSDDSFPTCRRVTEEDLLFLQLHLAKPEEVEEALRNEQYQEAVESCPDFEKIRSARGIKMQVPPQEPEIAPPGYRGIGRGPPKRNEFLH